MNLTGEVRQAAREAALAGAQSAYAGRYGYEPTPQAELALERIVDAVLDEMTPVVIAQALRDAADACDRRASLYEGSTATEADLRWISHVDI